MQRDLRASDRRTSLIDCGAANVPKDGLRLRGLAQKQGTGQHRDHNCKE
jgi:hypothetical protein